MSYYEKLQRAMHRQMRLHPQKTIVLDSATLKVLALGSTTAVVAKKLKRAKAVGDPVVFRAMDERAVWVLPSKVAR